MSVIAPWIFQYTKSRKSCVEINTSHHIKPTIMNQNNSQNQLYIGRTNELLIRTNKSPFIMTPKSVRPLYINIPDLPYCINME